MLKGFIRNLTVGLCLLSTACASDVPLSREPLSATAPTPALGAGDRLRIVVFGETTLTGEYMVGPDGVLALPLVGAVNVTDASPNQLMALIVDELSPDYMLDPQVTVDVVSYRPFFIFGEVTRAGQYPYVSGLSITQAIATAGGYSYRANKKYAFIRRAYGQREESFEIRADRPVWVMPGDTIRIGERYF